MKTGPDTELSDSDRYDRQLRLWGAVGQRALLHSHVIALGCSVTVVETAKNLLLSGIGRITLIDDERVVEPEDLAHHFFLSTDSVGKPLGSALATHLSSLNPHSTVHSRHLRLEQWISQWHQHVCSTVQSVRQHYSEWRSGVNYLDPFTPDPPEERSLLPSLLLVSQQYPDWSPLSQLSVTATILDVPCVYVEAHGLVGGWVEVHHPPPGWLPVSTHLDPSVQVKDLRPFAPFTALQRWFEQHAPCHSSRKGEAASGSAALVPHPPYLLILWAAYRRWTRRAVRRVTDRLPADTLPESAQKEKREEESLEKAETAMCTPRLSTSAYRELQDEIWRMFAEQQDTTPIPPTESWLTLESVTDAIAKCTPALNRASPLPLPAGLAALFEHSYCKEPFRALLDAGVDSSPKKEDKNSLEQYLSDLDVVLMPKCEWLERHFLRESEVCQRQGPEREIGQAQLALVPFQHVLLSWYIVHGVRCFVYHRESETASPTSSPPPTPRESLVQGCLPFNGFFPDVHTTTTWYTELREIYAKKHEEDVTWVVERALQALQSDLYQYEVFCRSAQQHFASDTPVKGDGLSSPEPRVIPCGEDGLFCFGFFTSHFGAVRRKPVVSPLNSSSSLPTPSLWNTVYQMAKEMIGSIWSLELTPFTCSHHALLLTERQVQQNFTSFRKGNQKPGSALPSLSEAPADLSTFPVPSLEEEMRGDQRVNERWQKVFADRLRALHSTSLEAWNPDDREGCTGAPQRYNSSAVSHDALFAAMILYYREIHSRAHRLQREGESTRRESPTARSFPPLSHLFQDWQKWDCWPPSVLTQKSLVVQAHRLQEELARQWGVEVPCVSAALGGMAAQEVVKLLQHRHSLASVPLFYSGYSNTVRIWSANERVHRAG